ncbi:hypothetical protein MLD52_07805 [Puniceicoccaceae bacterium K14]|nr:hypothetical protein [Puniceicoccaceae bacterium K14]
MVADLDTTTLNAKALKTIRKAVHLDQRGFARLSNNSRETVIKFEKSGTVSQGAKRNLAEAVRLLAGLSDIMEQKNISLWLTTPNRNYQNKSPLELIEAGRSDIIWSIIERARQSSFA